MPHLAIFDNLLGNDILGLSILESLPSLRCQVQVLKASLRSISILLGNAELWNKLLSYVNACTGVG
jgi:hypothetical protein